MTDTSLHAVPATSTAPLSRAAQRAVAGCLVAAALLIAVPQYVEHLLAGSLEREEQVAWGLDHQAFYRAEWACAMVGSFLLLIGFLGLWQVTRWSVPRLSAVGAIVLTWGMSGQIFSDVATYTSQVVAADIFGTPQAERLIADGYLHDTGMILAVLMPVILGMFIGVIMLAVALWRSGFPRAAVVVLALWPLWDFFGPGSLGPVTADLFLLVGVTWLGVVVARLPRSRWLGADG
jgi:hypothetical protein